MAKYLLKVSYTLDGIRGVRKEGGTARRDVADKLVANVGGTMEAFYFAFGSDDVFVIADLPDNKTAASVATTVSASGGATVETVVLLTPEDIDDAVKRGVDYRAPGQ
jgi:uncharacterized protein with GYD domain